MTIRVMKLFILLYKSRFIYYLYLITLLSVRRVEDNDSKAMALLKTRNVIRQSR